MPAHGIQIERLPPTRTGDGVPGEGRPTISLSTAYQAAPHRQLELFVVGQDGAVRVVHKELNSEWRPPLTITPPSFARPGAPLASVYHPVNNQVEVFVVGEDGAVKGVWKAQSRAWSAPFAVTPAGFAPPGAPIAAVFNPQNDQVEVFVVGGDGALKGAWKSGNGPWQPPFTLTPAGTARPGASVAAAFYPLNNHVEVFFVGRDGGVKGVWKSQNGPWQPLFAATPPNLALSGAPLAAVYHPPNHQLEVFTIGRDGAVRVAWKAQNRTWQGPVAISPPSMALPGSPIAAVSQPLHDQLEVFVVDGQGALRLLWKAGNGAWQPPVRLTPARTARAGVPVAAAFFPPNNHLEAFFADRDGAIRGVYKAQNSSWRPVFHVTGAGIAPVYTVAQCMAALKQWRTGGGDDLRMDSCLWIVGIQQFCRAQDATVVVAYGDRGRSHFACSPRHRRLTLGEEAELLVTGIGEGVADGFVAAAPYLGTAISGVACLKGVLFACAALALDLTAVAGVLPPEAADAVRIAEKIAKCAEGDVAACADAAAKAAKGGAKQFGLKLPDMEPGKNAEDADKCTAGDFAACARLGAAAAKIAGVPPGMSSPSSGPTPSASDCLDGNRADACLALGREAATTAGFPLKGIVQGEALAEACRRQDLDACRQLGRALALAAK